MSVFDYNPEFMKEIMYEPRDEELGDIKAPGPVGSVGGFAGRMLRKNVADPLRGMYRSVKKAQEGGFKDQEEMVKAGMEFAGNLVGTPGGSGGLGSGWRSRTLEAIAKNPKMPESASPQTWLSKLKGAGLPKDEVAKAESVLGMFSDPKSKLERGQLHDLLEHPKFLPTLGTKKTTLGGADWEAGQKRINELYNRIQEIDAKTKDIRHNVAVELGYPRRANTLTGEYKPIDNKEITAALKSRPDIVEMLNEKQVALNEHIKLSQAAVGKRPKWPQYNIEGLKDYKEEYFHAPLKEGGEYRNADMEMHFADKPDNLLYLKHQGTLELSDGKKSTHMSTLQNDHAAEFDKAAKNKNRIGAGLEDTDIAAVIGIRGSHEFSQLSGEAAASARERIAYLHNAGGGRQASRQQMRWAVSGESGDPQMDADYNRWFAEGKNLNKVPEPIMLNTWWKHGLKSSIRDAVKSGHDYFTWDPAETQMKRFAGAGEDVAQYMKNHYDNNIPGFLKKEYGVEAKKVDLTRPKAGLSWMEDPFTGDRVPIEQMVPTPRNIGGSNLYGIGRRYPDGHVEDFGYGVHETAEQAQQVIHHIYNPDKVEKYGEVWQIPITDEIKKKVQEGQFWSKAAKPGGSHAEGIA